MPNETTQENAHAQRRRPKQNALVTGGGGFIGSNLVAALLERGHDVTVLDDFSSGYRQNLTNFPNIKIIEGDVSDRDCVFAAARHMDTIYHLAASVGNKRSIDDPIRDAEINVMGTLYMLEAARQHGIRNVVISSSAGIFGELKTLPIAEDHPIDPDSPYGCSKLCAERHGLAYAKLFSLNVICLRYFNVYGQNQRFDAYGNVIPIFAFKMLRGEPITIFGDGEQTRDFVHVEDVVQANLCAGRADLSGAFNLGSGSRVTINKLVHLLQETSGIEAQIQFGPPRPGDVRDSLADVRLAEEKLHFKPVVDLGEGLRKYMQWAKVEAARS